MLYFLKSEKVENNLIAIGYKVKQSYFGDFEFSKIQTVKNISIALYF